MKPSGQVRIELHGGQIVWGEIWAWRPAEGWLQLVVDHLIYPNAPDDGRFQLVDCRSAVSYDQRVRHDLQADVDLLEKAMAEGWNGA